MLGTFRLQEKWTGDMLKKVGTALKSSKMSEICKSVLIFELLSAMDIEYEVAQARYTLFMWYPG